MSSRRMIYPYRFTDKLALFPYKFFWNNSWQFKYPVYGLLVALPVFMAIQNFVCSPKNVERFERIRARDEAHHKEHLKHLK